MTKYLILSCDGGGIRGFITASVLQKLAGAVDFMPQVSLNAGTSTGSFISLALASGVSIDTIQAQYQQANAAPIFTPNPNLPSSSVAALRAQLAAPAAKLGGIISDLWRYLDYLIYSSYATTGVERVAQTLLGTTTTLSQLAPVLVNTVQLDDTAATPNVWTPLTITNLAGTSYGSMLAWEAALCSGAAPIYFPPYSPTSAQLGYCADGGLFANNPSMAALAAALASGVALADIYMLSLDTGTSPDGMPGSIIDGFGGGLDMGPLQWLLPFSQVTGATTTPKFPLLSAIMDASSIAITQQAQAILGDRYFRVTVPLSGPVALDDTSAAAYTTMGDSLTAYYASSGYTAARSWLSNLGTGA